MNKNELHEIDSVCFIIPPHIESRTHQNTEDVSDEIRRRRIGALKFKRTLARAHPKNENLDDQDIFTAKRTFHLPGWKLADTEKDADLSYNRSVNVCWDNTKEVLDFYKNILGFDLKADLDGQVVSTVDVGEYFNNAFFNGEQMAYGEGDGYYFSDFCFDETVVCHELGHGVVNGTVPLVYQNESGALNESYADVFAICFSHYKSKKSIDKLTKDDWMIGEKCVVDEGALRSFSKTPARSGSHPLGPDSEPRHYNHRYRGTEDNGGVHINSSIVNHAFYKVCGYVGGNSWEVPLQVWFSLLKNKKITPYSNFSFFAKQLVREAKKLHGDEVAAHFEKGLKDVGLPAEKKAGKKRRKRRKRRRSHTQPEVEPQPEVEVESQVEVIEQIGGEQ